MATFLGAQEDNPWFSFKDKMGLIGYKDINGTIKIKPKFVGFSRAKRFDDIIEVVEKTQSGYDRYYLNKNGKKFGSNKLFTSQNTADCESEGYIRFQEIKPKWLGLSNKKLYGMFDKDGNVFLPAKYDFLSSVQDGFIITKQNGKYDLINTKKEILIKDIVKSFINTNLDGKKTSPSFFHINGLDFSTLIVSDQFLKNYARVYFEGVNGKLYSFIDRKMGGIEITKILRQIPIDKKILDGILYKNVYFIKNGNWIKENKKEFLKNNLEAIKKSLLMLKEEDKKYNIFFSHLDPNTYKDKEFDIYFNNCKESYNKYPVLNLTIDYEIVNKKRKIDHFKFLKIAKSGYKLIEVELKSSSLK